MVTAPAVAVTVTVPVPLVPPLRSAVMPWFSMVTSPSAATREMLPLSVTRF